MDQGTNTVDNGGLNTWFEAGYVTNNLAYGLPASGSTFNSQTQPTHHYQMGNYSTNNGTLIDANHVSANITPASPAPYNAFALLTAGGNIGTGNRMTNFCIMQHQDGVNETNTFYGYDWFEGTVPGFVAFVANGRVNMHDRTLNVLGGGNPKLFETYFTLSDTASPVTNMLLRFGSAHSANATTFIMAVSATAGGVPPVILNPPQWLNAYAGSTAQFSVTLGAGTTPVYTWQKGPSASGTFTNLSNGGNVSGSTTATLSLSSVSASDAAYYQVVITNAVGAATSSPVALYLLTSPLTNIDQPADSISDSSFANNIPPNPGEGVSNVVDRTTSKYLCYGSGPTNGQPPFQGPVGYVVTPAIGNTIVSAMRIYTANDAPERDPADCKLEGSNDGGSTWATILADTPLSLPDARNNTGRPLNVTNQVLQELDFANSTGYKTYRVTFNNVKTNATAIGLQVAEIELLGISSNAPIISPDLPATNYALAGATASFTVGVLGTSPFTNRWTYNNNPLTDGGRISGANTTTLTIANVQASDAGTYRFWSTNGLGTTGSTASTLVVENVLGFNVNGSGWKLNNGGGPPASFVGNNSLQLTTAGQGGQANSIFFHDPVYVRAFKAFFTYYDVNDGADGVCFVLQNAAAGINAVGAGGGGMGVRGITNSVEVELDLYSENFAYDTNGLTHEAGGGFPAGNAEFQLLGTGDDVGAPGQTKDMTILYNGSVMTLTWSNETSLATGTTNLNVGDITKNVGGSTAYVGFTGACGGIDDTQIVGAFQFIPLPMLSIVPGGGGVVITWPTGIGGYALQQNSNLSNPGGWTTIAGPYSIASGQYQVTVTPATGVQFYRLVVAP
jgi:hypothetical protein